jgi:hypothetical protein
MNTLRSLGIHKMNVTDCAHLNGSMKYYENRLKTFDSYPKQMLPHKYKLASAGLYNGGKSDVCECFRCPFKLSDWVRSNNPFREYYNCEYIKIVGAPQHKPTPIGGFGAFVSTTRSTPCGFGEFSSSTTGANLFVHNKANTTHQTHWIR